MMDGRADQSVSPRVRNRIVVAFAVLGLVVPAVLYPFVSYTRPLTRGGYTGVDRFLWAVVPYLWPSAPVVPTAGSARGDTVVFWAISLALNALIYSAAGWSLWRVARFIGKLRAGSRPS